MDTLFYSIAAIAALFASAFLFAFYENILSELKHRIKKANRVMRQLDRSIESQQKTALIVSGYDEGLLSEKEETAGDSNANTVAT